ncbi:hypothetical protein BG003_000633 [Podila horticola]|nr:hypothetical protein BG003_000633 [Podila horticola]
MAFIYKLAIVATALAMVSSAPVTDRYTTATEIPATDTTAFSEPIVTAAALLTADVHGGKSVTARVTDTCPSQFCSSSSLDLSQAVFQQLAPLATGVIDIQWSFV